MKWIKNASDKYHFLRSVLIRGTCSTWPHLTAQRIERMALSEKVSSWFSNAHPCLSNYNPAQISLLSLSQRFSDLPNQFFHNLLLQWPEDLTQNSKKRSNATGWQPFVPGDKLQNLATFCLQGIQEILWFEVLLLLSPPPWIVALDWCLQAQLCFNFIWNLWEGYHPSKIVIFPQASIWECAS